MIKGVMKGNLEVKLGDEENNSMIIYKNPIFQVRLIRNKSKTHKHVP